MKTQASMKMNPWAATARMQRAERKEMGIKVQFIQEKTGEIWEDKEKNKASRWKEAQGWASDRWQERQWAGKLDDKKCWN